MDFSINDNEWIVGKNTDRLNKELFGDLKEPSKSKRSRRRRKRKVEAVSQQNIAQKEPQQPSFQSSKTQKKHLNLKKDHSVIHNIKNRKRKLATLVSGKAVNCANNFKPHMSKHKNKYNHHKHQKLDSSTTDSSELLKENFSEMDYNHKLKKERIQQKKKLHRKNYKNNIVDLFSKQKCDIENKTLLNVDKLHRSSVKSNKYPKNSTAQKKRKKKTMNCVQNSLRNMSLDNQFPLSRLPNSNNWSTPLKITKLKDILKSAQFPHTTNLKLETKKERKKGMLILLKGKRKEYSDIIRKQATDKLKSAQFRFINEKMYTATGKESMHLFKLDPNAFEIYHDGFQAQVDKWPLNPVDIIINDIGKKPKTLTIADFGCGNAEIAQAFPDRKIYSFDLISMNTCVTACDMANVPLARESINIVIFCLALMGTNLNDYLCEAHRVLKMGGQLKIAEVISRMENADTFVNDLKKFGFTLSEKNISHKMFIFLDFVKTGKFDRTKMPKLELKPCLYKKR